MKFTVKMHHRLDPEAVVAVDSLAEASEVVRTEIESYGLGGSDMLEGFGEVCSVGQGSLVADVLGGRWETPVARVSYNGRVWEPGPWTPETRELLCSLCEREDGTHEERCAVGFDLACTMQNNK